MDEEERKFRLNFETAELAAAKFSSVKLMSANFQCGSRGGAVKQRTSLELRIANYPFAGWHKVREPGSSIAKDLIDSEDPKHTRFCRETAFVTIYALFKG